MLREPKRSNVHETMLEIRQKIEENKNQGKLTYVYFYYGGAGANDQSYHGQCGIFDSEDPVSAYPFERRLWDFSAMDNKCVVHAMFDCGRLRMTDGLEGWREDKDEEDKQWKEWKDKNTNYNGGCNILIFRSTGPCDQANAKSYLSKKFFDTIKKKCMMNGGRPVKSIDI